MIEVQNISKSFGSTQAVKDLSFTIDKGEVVGILGPNGAGKTTTMRMLTNYYEIDSGEIVVDGIKISENPLDIKKKIGYLPENNPLYEDMTVQEYLVMIARLRSIAQDRLAHALERAVDLTGIGPVFYRPMSELSKGYKQRVGLASAILHEPQILVLDEPTEGLDPNQRLEIRELLKKLGKDHTVLLSTHVLPEVQHTCDRLLIIHEGALAAEGTVAELLSRENREQRVVCEVEGERVRTRLETLQDVYIRNYALHEGRKHITIETAGGRDIRPDIFHLATRHQWVLWELRLESKGLEDVFTHLTKTE